MNSGKVEASAKKYDGSLLRTVISFVCLYAADVQLLLSLKLVFYDKEFATLGLSFVLLIIFLLPFLILSQRAERTIVFKLLGLIGPFVIGLVGAILIGLFQHEAVYAALIGVGAASFGVLIFAISMLIRALASTSSWNPDDGSANF